MTTSSNSKDFSDASQVSFLAKRDYGYARIRDIAFDAVHLLWARRKRQGVKLKDVANRIGRDSGWVSKQLRGPGNWTLRTFGELVEALDGEAEIEVFGLDEPPERSNYDAYSDYESKARDQGIVNLTFEFENLRPRVAPPSQSNVTSILVELVS